MNDLMVHQQHQVSLIDGLDIATVQQTMQKIASFQAVVQATLKKDHDYGVIPGTQKPTMLKPGGEKICMMMGISPEYDFLDKEANYEKGFFNYEVKCTLKRGDQKVAQGVGSCNSYEKKYRYINVDTLPPNTDPTAVEQVTDRYGRTKFKIQNPNVCDLANTILKMAKKRAFIDAVLQVSSLSEIFTQDLEDMKEFIQQEQQIAASTMTAKEAGALKLSFGKHKGKTLKEIYKDDNYYFKWLKDNATDQVIKQGIEIMLNELNNMNQSPQQEPQEKQPPSQKEFVIPEDGEGDDPF